MNFENVIQNDEIVVFANTAVFSKEAVLKAIYWYGDKFHTNIAFVDDSTLKVVLKPTIQSGMQNDDLELYLQKLERDLVDFQLRTEINMQTQNVRELLLAKAFSNGEYDELPPGEVSDPVGFSVESAVLNDNLTV